MSVNRRNFIIGSLVAGGGTAAAVGLGVSESARAAGTDARSPFGPLGPPDANGLQLPRGFTSRVVARTGERVPGTNYVWHANPDGAAIFRNSSGYVYVSSSEVSGGGGGVSMIRFNGSGTILGARRLMGGSSLNCSGGPTPWNTYMSCEEISRGKVYEVAPLGQFNGAKTHDAMGYFTHEAATCDPDRQVVYMTEDRPDGCLYRYVPTTWGDLSKGELQVLCGTVGRLSWKPIPNPTPGPNATSTRLQVPDAMRFNGGEGCWYHQGRVYFTTKGDDRIWILEPATMNLRVLYSPTLQPQGALRGVDNCVIAPTGDIAIVEDGSNYEVCIVDGQGRAGVVCRLTGVSGSELTGPAFNPWGSKLYFASQRNPGAVYEISGNFTRYR